MNEPIGGSIHLKARGEAPRPWSPGDLDDEVRPDTPLDEAEFVALDIETTGNRPFLVLEIGAERFSLGGPIGLFDTLVDCRAPINPYARRRHQITRDMLVGAPDFSAARRAFLNFAHGAVLVEHSHDAFDSWLVARGLGRPLPNPIVDTTALGRLVLELPSGQTPGLSRLVAELGLDHAPAHAALGDAIATAGVFRELVTRGRERFGWGTVGDLVGTFTRPEVDRSSMEPGVPQPSRRGAAGGRAGGGSVPTGQPRSAAPESPPGATSPAPSARRGRSRRRRRSGSSSPGDSPAGNPGA